MVRALMARASTVRGLMGALLTALLIAAPAQAETWRPLIPAAEVSVAGRLLPLGVAVNQRSLLRYRLVPPDSVLRSTKLGNALFEQTFVSMFTALDLNPAFARAGFGVEVSPAAVWRMRAWYQAIQHFGTFNMHMRYDSAKSDYSPRAARARAKTGLHHGPDLAHRLVFENTFQARIWRIVGLSLLNVEGFTVRKSGYYYNGEYDLLVRGEGEIIARHIGAVALVLLSGPKLPEVAVGGFHGIARSVFAQGQNQQAGVVIMYSPVADQWLLYRTGLTVLMGAHVQDKYKTGLPYAVLLFNMAFQ